MDREIYYKDSPIIPLLVGGLIVYLLLRFFRIGANGEGGSQSNNTSSGAGGGSGESCCGCSAPSLPAILPVESPQEPMVFGRFGMTVGNSSSNQPILAAPGVSPSQI